MKVEAFVCCVDQHTDESSWLSYGQVQIDGNNNIELKCRNDSCTWGNPHTKPGEINISYYIKLMESENKTEKVFRKACDGNFCSAKAKRTYGQKCKLDFLIKLTILY